MGGLSWSDLTATPDEEAIAAIRSSWRWLLGDGWTPVLFSVWGDVFLKTDVGIVWLNTGTAELSTIARDEDELRTLLTRDRIQEWFLPSLVASLHADGKRPGVSQCFSYAIYPVFAEGKYESWNFAAVPLREHFEVSGHLHEQLASISDAKQVRMQVVP